MTRHSNIIELAIPAELEGAFFDRKSKTVLEPVRLARVKSIDIEIIYLHDKQKNQEVQFTYGFFQTLIRRKELTYLGKIAKGKRNQKAA